MRDRFDESSEVWLVVWWFKKFLILGVYVLYSKNATRQLYTHRRGSIDTTHKRLVDASLWSIQASAYSTSTNFKVCGAQATVIRFIVSCHLAFNFSYSQRNAGHLGS